jgi:DNA polymerase (family 10)
MSNKEIAELLRKVAVGYIIKDEAKYRFQIIAYEKAASSIESSSSQVADLIKENRISTLPGVGTSIQKHLEELVNKGEVEHFKWVLKGIPNSIFPLLKVHSLGPKSAYKLIKAFKLNNESTVINDLKEIAKKGKIADLSDFGEKSQEQILKAINEYEKKADKPERMVLPYAFELSENIINYMNKSKDVLRIEALGSLRRMMPTVGDIDLAVSTNNPKKIMDHFIQYPYKERVLDKGEVSSSILVSGGHRVDLKIQPKECFGSLLQHFTGSKEHNIHLRELALKKGLSLSEYGIKDKKGNVKQYKSEEDFYNDLGLSFIPPEMREDRGEIELALINKLPKIVEIKDIRGDLHLHSSFPIEPSHDLGKDSIEDMLKKGEKLGYEYLGFSEHNPSVSKHNLKDIMKILENKKNKIEQLNSSTKYIRSFNLLEVDINADGELPFDESCLDLMDAVIVSIHSSFRLNKKEMTDRVIKGLSHRKVKILGHPTGRKINEREGYELDWKNIFEFCHKENKAVEINSWPNRLDIDDILVRQAIDMKVKLVINTDSHAAYQMDNMKFGVAVARRGWAKKSDIINTFSYNELKEWFRG